jgi:hypothetical protein
MGFVLDTYMQVIANGRTTVQQRPDDLKFKH